MRLAKSLPKPPHPLNALLTIGPEYRLILENFPTKAPQNIGETTLLLPELRHRCGKDVFAHLLKDQASYTLKSYDLIHQCVGPLDALDVLKHPYELGLVKNIEIAFFTHVLVHIHTKAMYVPVINDKKESEFVDLERPWPSNRRIMMIKR